MDFGGRDMISIRDLTKEEIEHVLGVAEGNMWPVSNALTNRWFPAREHSRAQSFWLTGATSGTAIAIPVVTALMLASGW
ncbi:MAG: MFS transporter, partial [Candidatus Hydrothermarchaeota archaeon]